MGFCQTDQFMVGEPLCPDRQAVGLVEHVDHAHYPNTADGNEQIPPMFDRGMLAELNANEYGYGTNDEDDVDRQIVVVHVEDLSRL